MLCARALFQSGGGRLPLYRDHVNKFLRTLPCFQTTRTAVLVNNPAPSTAIYSAPSRTFSILQTPHCRVQRSLFVSTSTARKRNLTTKNVQRGGIDHEGAQSSLDKATTDPHMKFRALNDLLRNKTISSEKLNKPLRDIYYDKSTKAFTTADLKVLLSTCYRVRDWETAIDILGYAKNAGKLTAALYTMGIQVCCISNHVDAAERLSEYMHEDKLEKNDRIYLALILAWRMKGDVRKCFELYMEMKGSGINLTQNVAGALITSLDPYYSANQSIQSFELERVLQLTQQQISDLMSSGSSEEDEVVLNNRSIYSNENDRLDRHHFVDHMLNELKYNNLSVNSFVSTTALQVYERCRRFDKMLSYVCEVQRNNGYVSTSAWICLVSALFKLGREREVKYILDAMFDWHEYFPSASSPTSPASREPNHVASRTSLTVDNFTIRFDKVGKTVAEFLLKGDVNDHINAFGNTINQCVKANLPRLGAQFLMKLHEVLQLSGETLLPSNSSASAVSPSLSVFPFETDNDVDLSMGDDEILQVGARVTENHEAALKVTNIYNQVVQRLVGSESASDHFKAFEIFQMMEGGNITKNYTTYHSLFLSCRFLQVVQWKGTEVVRIHDEPESSIKMVLRRLSDSINVLSAFHPWEKAVLLFDKMEKDEIDADTKLFNLVIRTFSLAGKVKLSQELMERMTAESIPIDLSTHEALFSGMKNDSTMALNFLQENESEGASISAVNWALVSAAHNGQWKIALELLDKLELEHGNDGKKTRIQPFSYNKVLEALSRALPKPKGHDFINTGDPSVMESSSTPAAVPLDPGFAFSKSKEIFNKILSQNLPPKEIVTAATLVMSVYGKCGEIEAVLDTFSAIHNRFLDGKGEPQRSSVLDHYFFSQVLSTLANAAIVSSPGNRYAVAFMEVFRLMQLLQTGDKTIPHVTKKCFLQPNGVYSVAEALDALRLQNSWTGQQLMPCYHLVQLLLWQREFQQVYEILKTLRRHIVVWYATCDLEVSSKLIKEHRFCLGSTYTSSIQAFVKEAKSSGENRNASTSSGIGFMAIDLTLDYLNTYRQSTGETKFADLTFADEFARWFKEGSKNTKGIESLAPLYWSWPSLDKEMAAFAMVTFKALGHYSKCLDTLSRMLKARIQPDPTHLFMGIEASARLGLTEVSFSLLMLLETLQMSQKLTVVTCMHVANACSSNPNDQNLNVAKRLVQFARNLQGSSRKHVNKFWDERISERLALTFIRAQKFLELYELLSLTWRVQKEISLQFWFCIFYPLFAQRKWLHIISIFEVAKDVGAINHELLPYCMRLIISQAYFRLPPQRQNGQPAGKSLPDPSLGDTRTVASAKHRKKAIRQFDLHANIHHVKIAGTPFFDSGLLLLNGIRNGPYDGKDPTVTPFLFLPKAIDTSLPKFKIDGTHFFEYDHVSYVLLSLMMMEKQLPLGNERKGATLLDRAVHVLTFLSLNNCAVESQRSNCAQLLDNEAHQTQTSSSSTKQTKPKLNVGNASLRKWKQLYIDLFEAVMHSKSLEGKEKTVLSCKLVAANVFFSCGVSFKSFFPVSSIEQLGEHGSSRAGAIRMIDSLVSSVEVALADYTAANYLLLVLESSLYDPLVFQQVEDICEAYGERELRSKLRALTYRMWGTGSGQ